MATEAAFRGADEATLGPLIDEQYGAMHRFARLVGRDLIRATVSLTEAALARSRELADADPLATPFAA